jgi:hypothetical protein
MAGLPASVRFVALLALAGSALPAQDLRVYSEFVRVGPDGEIVAADRIAKPREIISPAALKNAFVTLRLVVAAPPDATYYLHLGQNPEDLVDLTLYQEQYQQVGEAWVPDRLERVTLPHGARLSEGQNVQTYLLDIFVKPKTPMTRIRLEIQLNVGQGWTIYPLELRVRDRSGPGGGRPLGPLPAVAARADMAVIAPLREYLCGDALSTRGPVPLTTLRALLVRNMRQDLAAAREREKEEGAGVPAMLLKAGGWADAESFCKARGPAPAGAEWWLRARNYLYLGLPVR